jgi:5-methylcytosine-specific restriction protein A
MPTGWVGSNLQATLPSDWGATTLRILNRDRHRCQHIREDTGRGCLKPAHEVDHISNHASGGTDDDSNLQALCSWHHGKKSGREGGTASGRSRRAKRDAVKPLHPGLLDEPPKTTPTRREGPPPF